MISLQVKALEAEILPLRESNGELLSQVEVLMGEKASLEKEVQNWKTRANHLIEECNRIDKEELEKAR